MGASPVTHPSPGASGGVCTPHQGAFSPHQAKKFFEFFQVGTHREVLLLGELAEQLVHFVRSKGHKVLCSAGVGPCELCELAAVDKDTSVRQVEYLAPAYVRHWRERDYHQRVAVFSAGAGEEVMRLLPAGQRNGRLDVERVAQGTSGRFRIKLMPGLPADFPSVLPPAFDLVPFVRARFGKRQTADRPLVFLPDFKLEHVPSPGRPKGLGLTADDCRPSGEELAKVKELLRAKLGKLKAEEDAERAAVDPADTLAPPTATPAPAPAADSKAEASDVVRLPVRGVRVQGQPAGGRGGDPASLGGVLAFIPAGRLGGGQPDIDEQLDSVSKLCADLKRTAPCLNGKNGTVAGKGGAE